MNDKLYDLLKSLPKENLINILWESLDHMQSHNIRSRMNCVMLALGAIEQEDENTGKILYKFNKDEIEKRTKNMSL